MSIKNRRVIKGKVIRVHPKTLIVYVQSKTIHPIYKKEIKISKKYHVHDEKSVAKLNDYVYFRESRPYSATKRFEFLKKVNERSVLR